MAGQEVLVQTRVYIEFYAKEKCFKLLEIQTNTMTSFILLIWSNLGMRLPTYPCGIRPFVVREVVCASGAPFCLGRNLVGYRPSWVWTMLIYRGLFVVKGLKCFNGA